MNPEQIHILAEIMANHALVIGMQADNQAREAAGDSPAWVFRDFAHHASELELLGQKVLRT